ncbi:MAG: DUF2079 domain-containing protein [Phycisphaerales bacterium]|nr:MAG: DUF2079 domain-containing protein [Phycisphaerales bacterium]
MQTEPIVSETHKKLQTSGAVYGLLVIMIIYSAFFIAYSLQKHAAFQTAGFDLGNWDQIMWSMLHGRPFWITQYANTTNTLGGHVEFILLLLFPLYGLHPGPETLLVFQPLLVALGALPVYWLAEERLRSQVAGLIFAAVYLLYPALQSAVAFDFHGLTVAVPFLTYALWAMYTRRYRLFAVMAILAMTCKEDIPLLVLMMGLYILLMQRNPRVGLATVGVSAAWFVIANFVIVPAYSVSADSIHIHRYSELGDNMSQVILTLVTNPWRAIQIATAGDKRFYWIRFTMPVAFTALLDPLTLVLAAPLLFINTLGHHPPAYQLDLYHSSGPLAVYVTFASINGLARLIKFAGPKFKHASPGFLRGALLTMVLLVTLAYQVQFGHTPIGRFFRWPAVTEHHTKAKKMLAHIPPQAVVAAQNNLVPHLSQRQWIFILPNLSLRDKQPDYIALDMRDGLDPPYHFVEEYCAHINEFLASPDYGLIFADDGLLLFQRDAFDTAAFDQMSPCQ